MEASIEFFLEHLHYVQEYGMCEGSKVNVITKNNTLKEQVLTKQIDYVNMDERIHKWTDNPRIKSAIYQIIRNYDHSFLSNYPSFKLNNQIYIVE